MKATPASHAHQHDLVRIDEHDAYACLECDIWIEDVCGDERCQECRDRPERPSLVSTSAKNPAVKYEMVWKDGRRESTDAGGGLAIITTIRENGRDTQVTFRLNQNTDGRVMEYVEAEREDVTERMREAAQRNRERTMDYMRKGWQYDEDMAEKDAEIARLRALLGSA